MSARRPLIQLRLRTVLLVVSVFVLVLPVAGLQVLRIYESALLRQTESRLLDQAALVARTFQDAYEAAPGERSPANGEGRAAGAAAERPPRTPVLDFAEFPVHPPFPQTRPGAAANARAAYAGARLQPVLEDAQAVRFSSIRVADAQGVVVASTGDDLGRSVRHAEEVQVALGGMGDSRLRERPGQGAPRFAPGGAVDVFVAEPIFSAGEVVGAALVQRPSRGIVDALRGKLTLLLQAAAVILVTVVGIALFTARTLVLPIRRISRGAERVSRNETDRFDVRGRPYRIVEVAQLERSIEAMAVNLQQRADYVRNFVRHVSHEFKTPIAALRGTVEVLRDHGEDGGGMSAEQHGRFLANAAADIDRLDRLTRRLLELAYADTAPATDETTDVLQAAREIDSDRVHTAGDGPALARIPRSSLDAVYANLVDNALQHGATRVDISAGTSGSALQILVADDGPGISDGNRDSVFEPFFTTRRDSGGTGLGLSIARSLVRIAGGDIVLESGAPGAVFRITLPPA